MIHFDISDEDKLKIKIAGLETEATIEELAYGGSLQETKDLRKNWMGCAFRNLFEGKLANEFDNILHTGQYNSYHYLFPTFSLRVCARKDVSRSQCGDAFDGYLDLGDNFVLDEECRGIIVYDYSADNGLEKIEIISRSNEFDPVLIYSNNENTAFDGIASEEIRPIEDFEIIETSIKKECAE